MLLSKRLQTVADSVTKGNRVADVGCDHAYISIYLIQNDIAPQVIAMDVNIGPLERAKNNITNYCYTDRIDTILSDGLQKLEPGEADTILIAGMGGALTVKILEEGIASVKRVNELILQPQSELFLVRKLLHKIKFSILEEQMLIEDGKYYVVMKAVPGQEEESYTREVFYQYGKLLLEKKDPVAHEYLLREKRIRDQVVDQLKLSPTDKSKERLEEVQQEIEYINEGLLYYLS